MKRRNILLTSSLGLVLAGAGLACIVFDCVGLGALDLSLFTPFTVMVPLGKFVFVGGIGLLLLALGGWVFSLAWQE